MGGDALGGGGGVACLDAAGHEQGHVEPRVTRAGERSVQRLDGAVSIHREVAGMQVAVDEAAPARESESSPAARRPRRRSR
jgi:hypothetical protein